MIVGTVFCGLALTSNKTQSMTEICVSLSVVVILNAYVAGVIGSVKVTGTSSISY